MGLPCFLFSTGLKFYLSAPLAPCVPWLGHTASGVYPFFLLLLRHRMSFYANTTITPYSEVYQYNVLAYAPLTQRIEPRSGMLIFSDVMPVPLTSITPALNASHLLRIMQGWVVGLPTLG